MGVTRHMAVALECCSRHALREEGQRDFRAGRRGAETHWHLNFGHRAVHSGELVTTISTSEGLKLRDLMRWTAQSKKAGEGALLEHFTCRKATPIGKATDSVCWVLLTSVLHGTRKSFDASEPFMAKICNSNAP